MTSSNSFEEKKNEADVGVVDAYSEEEADAVFGAAADGKGPNYLSLGWIKATFICIKSMIGLGVLAVPYCAQVMGAVPSMICMWFIWVLMTFVALQIVGYKLRHPEVYSVADAAYREFGVLGREVAGAAYVLYVIFCVGSSLLTISIGLNYLSNHGTCTVVFTLIAACFLWGTSSIRTLSKVGWIMYIGAACILIALGTLVIAVGVEDRPSAAPATGPWSKDLQVVAKPSFIDAMNIISTLTFCLSGSTAFWPVIAEMPKPQDFKKSIWICQLTVIGAYTIAGMVTYYYAGQYVTSPALATASPIVRNVCYGFAIVSLLASTTLYIHLAAKFIFVRVLRGSKHLVSNTPKHWIFWFGATAICSFIPFVIAEAITVFSNLVSLIGALFGVFTTLQAMPALWLSDHKAKIRAGGNTLKFNLIVAANVIIFVLGCFLQITGTIVAAMAIHNQIKDGTETPPFSCASNA
ncbi:hypothetical protein MNV49_001270 [Pseudohyphozyma bogoriensis]|nr:hypothetical protein MNV49_001270 [Pseudohyphozyma bogoriensis]